MVFGKEKTSLSFAILSRLLDILKAMGHLGIKKVHFFSSFQYSFFNTNFCYIDNTKPNIYMDLKYLFLILS